MVFQGLRNLFSPLFTRFTHTPPQSQASLRSQSPVLGALVREGDRELRSHGHSHLIVRLTTPTTSIANISTCDDGAIIAPGFGTETSGKTTPPSLTPIVISRRFATVPVPLTFDTLFPSRAQTGKSALQQFPNDQGVEQEFKQDNPGTKVPSDNLFALLHVFPPKLLVTESEVGADLFGTTTLPEAKAGYIWPIHVQPCQRTDDEAIVHVPRHP